MVLDAGPLRIPGCSPSRTYGEIDSTPKKKGEQRYLELRDQVKTQDAAVFKARTINAKPRKYAHRTHASVVTQPWRGLLSLGTLATDETLVAIGQSRHLGGGLLVPHDVSKHDF